MRNLFLGFYSVCLRNLILTSYSGKSVCAIWSVFGILLSLTRGCFLQACFLQGCFLQGCFRNLSCSWNFTPGLWYLLLVLKSHPKFNQKSHTSGWISFWQSASLQPKFGIYFSSVSDSSPISKCNPSTLALRAWSSFWQSSALLPFGSRTSAGCFHPSHVLQE